MVACLKEVASQTASHWEYQPVKSTSLLEQTQKWV